MKNIFKKINLHPAAPQRNVKATVKIIVDNTVVNTSELSFFTTEDAIDFAKYQTHMHSNAVVSLRCAGWDYEARYTAEDFKHLKAEIA